MRISILILGFKGLRMLNFEERGKPEYPVKNLFQQEKNQQQTQPIPHMTLVPRLETWASALTSVSSLCP